MQKIEQKGLTRQQVIDVLHGVKGPREIKFRYDLLDKNEQKKDELLTVESGEVGMNAFQQIKRTAKFRIRDDGSINWLEDRIQPFILLRVKGQPQATTPSVVHRGLQGTAKYTVIDGNTITLPGRTTLKQLSGRRLLDL